MTVSTDMRVVAQLLHLNLLDELEGRTDMTSADMHGAFVRALHNTTFDVPGRNRHVTPTKSIRRKRRRLLGFGWLLLNAAIAAAVVRLTLFRMLGR